jgi:adenylosuccinate lyase
LHEAIRAHSQAAGARVKEEGLDNDLLERLAGDPAIGMTKDEIDAVLDMKEFVGRAPEQVVEFAESQLGPALERNANRLGADSDVRV